MTVRDFADVLESWAPKQIAWDRDNVGLQVGDPALNVRAVLVALDVTKRIIAEARNKRANLVVSHHPLLFKSLRSVSTDDETGRCIHELVRSGISLYSAHTNLDFARGGTSFALATALGLTGVDFLYKPYQMEKKIVTFVPAAAADRVASAMADAGAGKIGNYDLCSFRSEGTGTFRGNMLSQPAAGRKGELEHVREIRLEMVVPPWRVDQVTRALLAAHPYEEVAYDIYASEKKNDDYGMGVMGELRRPMKLAAFLSATRKALGVKHVRYTGDPARRVRRVAACAGSGSDLLDEALRQGADVFVTADAKYHTFHHAAGSIALLDAGHHETEFPVVRAVVERLRQELRRRKQRTPVYAALVSTNPIRYV